jgi:hypothetical protein
MKLGDPSVMELRVPLGEILPDECVCPLEVVEVSIALSGAKRLIAVAEFEVVSSTVAEGLGKGAAMLDLGEGGGSAALKTKADIRRVNGGRTTGAIHWHH